MKIFKKRGIIVKQKSVFTLKSGSISPSMSNRQNSLQILDAVYKAISFYKRRNTILFTSQSKKPELAMSTYIRNKPDKRQGTAAQISPSSLIPNPMQHHNL